MALRIAALSRINGPACDHLTLTIEEGPMGGPADRSLVVQADVQTLDREDGVEILGRLLTALPTKGLLKGAYLFSWAMYQRQVNARTLNQIVCTWIE